MPLVFACSASHTPGIRAWPEGATAPQREAFYSRFDQLRERMLATRPDTILIVSSEHFANFFLDCMPAFTMGQAEHYFGPVESWVRIEQGLTRGDPELAARLLTACYEDGVELNYAAELKLDHGIMIPLSFLDPDRELPIVPLIINAMTYPMPTQKRCYALGRALGDALERDPRRVAVVAAGGLSHAPGERMHGDIDSEFDAEFIRRLETHDVDGFTSYTDEELERRGLGTHEIRAWVAVAGIAEGRRARTMFYEPIAGWATGCGLLFYE